MVREMRDYRMLLENTRGVGRQRNMFRIEIEELREEAFDRHDCEVAETKMEKSKCEHVQQP